MKVYVLNSGYDYEGEGLVAVFATLEAAMAHVSVLRAARNGPDGYFIYEAELGDIATVPKEVWSDR